MKVRTCCQVDNTQAIAAVERGYSKKLRHLQRTHRISIGVMHECITDPEMAITVKYCPTEEHKGDAFTKQLGTKQFAIGRSMMGMMDPKCE